MSPSSGKSLVIPDIHLNWTCANRIIDLEQPDQIWFLGDYFDDYGDSLEQVEETCGWLLRMCEDRRVHLLLGNHDVYYFCDNKAYRSAGYSRQKHFVIRKHFTATAVREKFRLHGRTNGYLLSHAGFSGRWLSRYSVALLDRHFEEAFRALLTGELHPLLDIGVDRGGLNEVGGVTWCDWRYFKPIPGVPQIVGHTVSSQVRWASFEKQAYAQLDFRHCVAGVLEDYEGNAFVASDDVSLCLDTALRHYAVIESSGELRVKQTPEAFLC